MTERLRHPVVASLNVSYDRDKIMEEIKQNYHMFMQSGASLPVISNPPKDLDIIDAEHLKRTYYHIYHPELGDFTHHRQIEDDRPVNTWKVINLLEIPGYPGSRHGSNKDRVDRMGEWVWRSDVHFPYLTSIVRSLPFKRVDIVRIFTIQGPGCGPVHKDTYDGRPFFDLETQMVNINLQPSLAGTPLRILYDGKQIDIDESAFAFRDHVWHGVPYFETGFRASIKLIGSMDYRDLFDLIDHSSRILM